MSANTHNNTQQTQYISIPYTKLLPLLICGAVVAALNLLSADIVHYISKTTDRYTFVNTLKNTNITLKYNRSAIIYHSKDAIVDAIYSTLSNKQINKILQYLYNPPTFEDHKNIAEYHLKPLNNNLFKAIPLKTVKKVKKAEISKPNSTEYEEYISLLIERSSEFKETLWYQYLNEYGLELELLSLKDGESFMSHPINDRFIMYPKLKIMEYFVCESIGGFGNGLSVYWGVRSLAYWMNFNFKISCRAYRNNLFKDKLMSAFLPSSVGIDINIDKTTNIIFENLSVISFYPKIDRAPTQHSVIHPTSLFFMYYNPYFQNIMNYETMTAMNDYYDYNKRNDQRKEMDKMMETNDIVIHIRCGDVLQIMHRVKDWDYGFLTMNHYKYVMETALQRVFGINWYNKITNDTTVWILSQLTQNALRRNELKALKDCDFLINYIVDHGIRNLFKPSKIKIMYDSDVNDDFYRMLNAPLLFCSPSTYCLNAGIANTKGIVVIPSRGAWVGFHHIHNRNITDFIVAQNSELIPKNQLIIDTEKAGWHCNKIQFNQHTYNQNKYTHQLAEYLVEH